MFVAGELDILTSKLPKAEFKGRMRFLKKLVYYANIYGFKCFLRYNAAWLRRNAFKNRVLAIHVIG